MRVFAFCVLSCAAAACAQPKAYVTFTPATAGARTPHASSNANIPIFVLKRPPAPYVVLGTPRMESHDADVLRREAARHGCDALIVETAPRYFPSARTCANYESPLVEAACVRFESASSE